MENIVNIQDHQEPGYPALAAEKIAAELKSFTGGSKDWQAGNINCIAFRIGVHF